MAKDSGKTSVAPYRLRLNSLMRVLMQILAEHPEGLHNQDMFRELKLRMPPTESEIRENDSGVMRYVTNVRFWSVGLVKAEYVTKIKRVWCLTDRGRAALDEFPDAASLGAEIERLYHQWDSTRPEVLAGHAHWSANVDQILARVPAGTWVAASDLGKVSGTSGGWVGIHMWRDKPPGWFRVLRRGGHLPADAYDDKERLAEQRALLAGEGITSDPKASLEQRLPLADLEGIAAEFRGAPGAWLIRGTSVRGSSIVPMWLRDHVVSLPASQLPAIDMAGTDDDLRAAVEAGYDGLGYSQRTAKFEEIRTFLRRVKPGHLIVTLNDAEVFIGEVAGDASQVESPGRRSNLRRSVDWSNPDEPIDQSEISARLAGRLRTQADIVDLSDAYEDVTLLLSGINEDIDPTEDPDDIPEPEAFLLSLDDNTKSQLLISGDWLDEFVELLRERRQVILYGPPGTGKTFLAQAVAEALAGPERVRLVQFHPSYSYEDFFEGYRPAGTAEGGVSLQLVPGPFRKVVDLARANPTQPYFLIIDEINRANLAKVFGELYFLLEYRDRTIDLLYSSGDGGPSFSLPANVYVIGTMNTADRSIALVDSAMRRRFGFLSLHPVDERLDLVLRAWLADRRLPEDRADLLVALNSRIDDKDFKIGPSYLMTHVAGTDTGLDRIWRTSILPLLAEYHVGDGIDVRSRYGLPALQASLGTSNIATGDEELAGQVPPSAASVVQ